MDYIFKKETVQKKNFVARLKQILTESGWQNISSRPSTDFDVFYSEGEDGNSGLYFALKDYSTSTQYAFSSTPYGLLYIRPLKGYTPSSTAGGAGTFERTTDSWREFRLCANMPAENYITFYYHCDKNRLCVHTDFPPSYPLNSTYSAFFTVGIPSRTFGVKAPKQDLIFTCSNYDNSGGNKVVYVVDQSDTPRTNSYSLTSYDMYDSFGTHDKSLASNGKLFFSEVAYGNNTEGIRGILDGVYVIREQYNAWWNSHFWFSTIKHGDQFIDEEGRKYMIVAGNQSPNYGVLSSKFFAFRIE